MSLIMQWNFGRAMIVAIVICSWLVISNHCAFGAIAAPVHETQSACPFHSKPAKPQPSQPRTQCCKTLRAVVPVVTKGWARDDAKFSDVHLRFEEFALIALSCGTKMPLLLDTGPPGALTFAELILQGSLLAHAPPARA
jgi:hypothetical protein